MRQRWKMTGILLAAAVMAVSALATSEAGAAETGKAVLEADAAETGKTVLEADTAEPGKKAPAAGDAQSEPGQQILYGIGSTSKVVATAAVMKLAEEGKISLDEPLTTYLPEFYMADSRYRKITPRMLLNHTSGLQGGTLSGSMLLGDSDTYNHDTLLEKLRTQRLKAEPGEFAAYCNDGFTLAEILTERISGMSFTDYIEKEFAEPLGLEHFATPQTPGIKERVAAVYDSATGGELPPEMANVIGSGGIYATAEDLCRFSQIFMRDQGDAAGIFSLGSAKQMEVSTFEEMVNPDRLDNTLSYGLGWDSVDTYPYSRYGIKALVKGGDTSFYHASLTVLPEENISCAVLTSGGSSMGAQLAVQEILMDYLEESGKVVRTSENTMEEAGNKPAGSVPEEIKTYSGFYAGSEMLYAGIGDDGKLVLENRGTGKDKKQTYEYHEDGRFYSTGGDYIDFYGSLAHSSDGKVGKSFLEFKKAGDGRDYLMAGIYEAYPKLGKTAVYLPVAERIEPEAAGQEITDAWKSQEGKEFYLVDEKYSSTFYMSHFLVKPLLSADPAGYLSFDNSELKMARLTSSDRAEFFQKVPGQVGRDLLDYRLVEENGAVYLEGGSSRYIREDSLIPLAAGENTTVIGPEGEAVWKSFGEELKGRLVTVKKPEAGAWYLYDHSGKDAKCTGSSWLYGDSVPFSLPGKGMIVFVGESGAKFEMEIQ